MAVCRYVFVFIQVCTFFRRFTYLQAGDRRVLSSALQVYLSSLYRILLILHGFSASFRCVMTLRPFFAGVLRFVKTGAAPSFNPLCTVCRRFINFKIGSARYEIKPCADKADFPRFQTALKIDTDNLQLFDKNWKHFFRGQ